MNLNHLLYFRTLAQYEHYHKASEVLLCLTPFIILKRIWELRCLKKGEEVSV